MKPTKPGVVAAIEQLEQVKRWLQVKGLDFRRIEGVARIGGEWMTPDVLIIETRRFVVDVSVKGDGSGLEVVVIDRTKPRKKAITLHRTFSGVKPVAALLEKCAKRRRGTARRRGR